MVMAAMIVVLGFFLSLGIFLPLDPSTRSNLLIAMEKVSGSTGSETVDRIAPSPMPGRGTDKGGSPPPSAREATIVSENRSGEPPARESEDTSVGPARVDWLDPIVPAEGLSISGRVQDEEGQPLPGIPMLAKAIRLFDADTEATHPAREAVRSAFTGFDGHFVFRD